MCTLWLRPAYSGQVDPLSPQRSFAAYGASHWMVLILFAVGVLVGEVLEILISHTCPSFSFGLLSLSTLRLAI